MAVQNTLTKANAAALYDEINNGATLTNTTIATNDLVGIGDVSAATGKKITISDLAKVIKTLHFISISDMKTWGYRGGSMPANFNGYHYCLIHWWSSDTFDYSLIDINNKILYNTSAHYDISTLFHILQTPATNSPAVWQMYGIKFTYNWTTKVLTPEINYGSAGYNAFLF